LLALQARFAVAKEQLAATLQEPPWREEAGSGQGVERAEEGESGAGGG